MIDLTDMILAIIGMAVTIFTVVLFPYARALKYEKNWQQLQNIVYVAIHAAEQLGITKVISDKLEYAINNIEKHLEKHKIKYDRDVIVHAIESAVRQNFPKPRT